MWGGVLVGISAVRAGQLNGVLLAVIALIPLAAFELVTGLPGAPRRSSACAGPLRACSRFSTHHPS